MPTRDRRQRKFGQHRPLLRGPWLRKAGGAHPRLAAERRVVGKAAPGAPQSGLRVITYDRRGFGQSSQPAFRVRLLHLDRRSPRSNDEARLARRGPDRVLDGRRRSRALSGERMDPREVRKAGFLGAIPPFLLKTPDNHFQRGWRGLRGDQERPRRGPAGVSGGVLPELLQRGRPGRKARQRRAGPDELERRFRCPPRGALDCVSAWLTDFRKDLAKIDVPTLVLHGDTDRIVPLDASAKRTHEAVRRQIVVVKDAPHGLTWTHADEVNRELVEFLGAERCGLVPRIPWTSRQATDPRPHGSCTRRGKTSSSRIGPSGRSTCADGSPSRCRSTPSTARRGWP